MVHEEAVVRAFIIPSKRSRYLSLLGSVKGRSKVVGGLDHLDDLDMRYARLIPAGLQTVDGIKNLLKQKGASTLCHVMSSNSAIDNQDMPLSKALEEAVGQGLGVIISCIPGKLAYYESEEPGERYILERPA